MILLSYLLYRCRLCGHEVDDRVVTHPSPGNRMASHFRKHPGIDRHTNTEISEHPLTRVYEYRHRRAEARR